MERQHCTQYFSYINSYKSKTINKVSRQKIMTDHRHQWTNSFSHVGCRGTFNPKRAQGRGTSLSQIVHGSQIQGFLGWRWTLGHFHPQNLSANVISSILCGIEISVGFSIHDVLKLLSKKFGSKIIILQGILYAKMGKLSTRVRNQS